MQFTMLFAINKDLFTPRLMVFYPCIALSLRGRDDPNSTFLFIYLFITLFNFSTLK